MMAVFEDAALLSWVEDTSWRVDVTVADEALACVDFCCAVMNLADACSDCATEDADLACSCICLRLKKAEVAAP